MFNILKAPLASIEHKVPRSTFDLSHSIKTTFNVGQLVPIDVQEVIPGDTFNVKTSYVARTSTMLFPVMDTAFLDVTHFFVPYRLLQKNFVKLMGENPDTPYTQPVDYQIPQITSPDGGWNEGTVADYMGIPTKVSGISVSALPFRAYAKIWNDFYRDQNLQNGAAFLDGDAVTAGTNGTDPITDAVKGGALLPSNKLQDYFTTCLPTPQKGGAVKLPLGLTAPVSGNALIDGLSATGGTDGLEWLTKDLTPVDSSYKISFGTFGTANQAAMKVENASGVIEPVYGFQTTGGLGAFLELNGVSGLEADLTNATAATINDLRQAFAVQRMLEIDAIGGTRYTEMIQAHYGVINPDARLQRAEFLGGKRQPLGNYTVPQTSATVANGTPQGNLAAYSYTADVDNSFVKSFTEHGVVITLATVRPFHTYQYGVDKMWLRKSRLDFHHPVFNNLGEQPVKNIEIYANGGAEDDEVFGYQEAWADLRLRTNKVTGLFRSNAIASLDSWHYADKYASKPVLSDAWIRETAINFDRTLAVSGDTAHQIIIDVHINNIATRCLPTYSVPAGLGRA